MRLPNPSPPPPPRSGEGEQNGLAPPLRFGEGVGGRGCGTDAEVAQSQTLIARFHPSNKEPTHDLPSLAPLRPRPPPRRTHPAARPPAGRRAAGGPAHAVPP